MSDFHVMLYGSRAAGGFGLLFPEQIAITPDGRTSVHCAGIWDDKHLDGLSRICRIVKEMGGVPAIQLGHTGRKGSETRPSEGKIQLPLDIYVIASANPDTSRSFPTAETPRTAATARMPPQTTTQPLARA